MRLPTLAEALTAYRERTEKQRQYDERQKRQLTLAYKGWSAKSIRDLYGPIGVWEDDLHPPGLPEHLSDRKSKRVWRKPRVHSFSGRYYEMDRSPGASEAKNGKSPRDTGG